jgi:hypothetical protein
LPCAVAVLVHFVRPPQPLAIAAAARPALAFHQYQVDLGRVEPTTELRATFVFRNRSDCPVDIAEVAPSCGCLVPYLSTKRVEPGEGGRIVLRMLPANESPGRKEFFADVKYADPEPRDVRLTFKLELPEKQMQVRPIALSVYQNSDRAIKQTIAVADRRPKPARIVNVTVDSPFVQVAPGEVRTLDEGGVEARVVVTVLPDVPLGRHEAVVTIQTDDPRSPVLRVPVRIERTTEPSHAEN